MIVCQLLHEDVDERNAGKTPCSRYDKLYLWILGDYLLHWCRSSQPSPGSVTPRPCKDQEGESRSGRMFASPLCLG